MFCDRVSMVGPETRDEEETDFTSLWTWSGWIGHTWVWTTSKTRVQTGGPWGTYLVANDMGDTTGP